jgi:hypothetical protein
MAGKNLFTADQRGPSPGSLCGEGANGQRKYHRKGAKDAKRRWEKKEGRRMQKKFYRFANIRRGSKGREVRVTVGCQHRGAEVSGQEVFRAEKTFLVSII